MTDLLVLFNVNAQTKEESRLHKSMCAQKYIFRNNMHIELHKQND